MAFWSFRVFRYPSLELSVFFRKKGYKNYLACGSQLLRNFLKASLFAIGVEFVCGNQDISINSKT